MNLRIELPPNLEHTLKLRAAAAGKDVESFVVDSILETLGLPESPNIAPNLDFQAWLEDVRKLIPPVTHFIDDSRESIYAGRGE
ncbi:MAG: hypothetical protein SGI77_01625 [Pirellulaceae bacterium]|nr:hypothetical protein [Pirellulaceae bacterium]